MRITLEFDSSPEDLDSVIFVANALAAVATPVAQPPIDAPTDAWNVHGWFGRLGEGSRTFWLIAASHACTNARWTFDDLVTTEGPDKETLRSYQRNSYRAIHAEKAADPLVSEWDVERGCNVYTMPDAVRDEILRLAQ